MSQSFDLKKIIIGTANFGLSYGIKPKKIINKEILKILNYSSKIGIDTIDTAKNYGNSENIIGKHNGNKFKIISKLPKLDKKIKNVNLHIEKLILDTLKKLKCRSIYAILIHDPETLMNKNGKKIFNILQQLKQRGLITKIGVSIYDFSQINFLIKKYNLDILQVPFNIVDRRLIEKKILEKLNKKHIEIHIRSIFLKGLLLKKNPPKKFIKWKNIWLSLKRYKKNSELKNLTYCIQFVKKYSKIDRIIIGVDTLGQFKEIIKEFKTKRKISIPNISSNDKKLINPSLW
jgi:aryl-alcohol dehydrogenase-like predicted oxidoreductase